MGNTSGHLSSSKRASHNMATISTCLSITGDGMLLANCTIIMASSRICNNDDVFNMYNGKVYYYRVWAKRDVGPIAARQNAIKRKYIISRNDVFVWCGLVYLSYACMKRKSYAHSLRLLTRKGKYFNLSCNDVQLLHYFIEVCVVLCKVWFALSNAHGKFLEDDVGRNDDVV